MRHHLVHHADAQRLLRVEMVAGEPPTVGGLPTAQRAEEKCRIRDVADLGLREHCLIRRDGDVGGELVPKASAHGQAVDRCNDGLAQSPHMRPARHAVGVGALPELDEIGERLAFRIGMPGAGLVGCALVVAGAEGAAGAGEDDHAHGAVRIRPVEDPMQLSLELVREGVHALGAIEGDGRNALLDAVKDLLAHPILSLLRGACGTGARPNNTLVRSKVKAIYVDATIAARGKRVTTCSCRSARPRNESGLMASLAPAALAAPLPIRALSLFSD